MSNKQVNITVYGFSSIRISGKEMQEFRRGESSINLKVRDISLPANTRFDQQTCGTNAFQPLFEPQRGFQRLNVSDTDLFNC